MWLPEITQSSGSDRPSRGTRKNANGPAYSIPSASSHSAQRTGTLSCTAPHSHSGAVAANQMVTRSRLRPWPSCSRAITRLT